MPLICDQSSRRQRSRGAGVPDHQEQIDLFRRDAFKYLQARGIGVSILTGNVCDFDFLNQLAPGVPIILYRHA
ncbi:hypothetical protein XH93_11610 [Bradyrhizobium sp. CCBAU 51753]|nr:hypothetical protein XH93_11610 [Bradyrhizobium sp. CCBAU 51753]